MFGCDFERDGLGERRRTLEEILCKLGYTYVQVDMGQFHKQQEEDGKKHQKRRSDLVYRCVQVDMGHFD